MLRLLSCFLFLVACEEESKLSAAAKAEPVSGQIVVLNSCGVLRAAEETKEILRANGFDVLSAQNDPQWSNYEETIVAIRNPHWNGYTRLKAVMDTKNFIVLQDTLSGLTNATVFVGKDYKKVFRVIKGDK